MNVYLFAGLALTIPTIVSLGLLLQSAGRVMSPLHLEWWESD